MSDFSPTKYIDKNVKLQYRNFDTNWHTVTVINIHGHNDNIFLGKFVYCDIKFDSGEIYNHFLFTDKEYESNTDNAWKFAHPWCVSVNEIKELNQKLSYTAFDYYNCTSSYDMFSDIQKKPVGHEIDVDDEFEDEFEEEEEFEDECNDDEFEDECNEDEFEEEDDEFEDDDEELEFDEDDECNEELEDFFRPNKRFRVYDNKLEDVVDNECNDDDDECNDELKWGRKGVRGAKGARGYDDECNDDDVDEEECNDDESIQSDIITIIYPGFWSTVVISSIISTIATTMIIYASHTACSIY